MTTVTLQAIKTEHARLAAMIAALESSAPKLMVLREAQIELHPGERYAGLVLDSDGLASHHLVLLPSAAEDVSWQDAKTWAASAGGELPTRQEQALLYANLKSEFEPRWYWSGQEHESDSSCAWNQVFNYGYQGGIGKSCQARARAVRRFAA
jgi:hypothetical protein